MTSPMVALWGLVAVVLVVAATTAWLFVRRVRERSREINAQMVELRHEIHDRVHEVNTRLDDLARLEKLARLDRATSAVYHAASRGQLATASTTKLLDHLQGLRDELSSSEPPA